MTSETKVISSSFYEADEILVGSFITIEKDRKGK